MMSVPTKIQAWQMVEPGNPKEKTPGKLERVTLDVPELQPGEALVKVAGCGV